MSIENNLDKIIASKSNNITLVAVTKHRSVDEIQQIVDYGVSDLGENRVQELLEKYDQVKGEVRWHLIGHLQTNKVKYIIDKVYMIHSVDSLKLAQEINRQACKHKIVMKILIQVNVSREESKFGIDIEEIRSFLDSIKDFEGLSVQGFMTMAPYTENIEESRHVFRNLHVFYDKIKNEKSLYTNVEINFLSMGMTNDYPIAIEEGSNLVRIGRGIFV